MSDLTPERLAELRKLCDDNPCYGDAPVTASVVLALLDEIDKWKDAWKSAVSEGAALALALKAKESPSDESGYPPGFVPRWWRCPGCGKRWHDSEDLGASDIEWDLTPVCESCRTDMIPEDGGS